jgi:hypothetical protein
MVLEAKGAAAMRNRETHFEQIPIGVVEEIVQRAAALEGVPENSPEPCLALVCNAAAEFPEQEAATPLKGQR